MQMSDLILAIEERSEGSLAPYTGRIMRMGLSPAGNGKYTGRKISSSQEMQVRKFAKAHNARFFFDDEYGTRSSDYRGAFYRAYPPSFHGRYFCAYCGRLIKGRTLTVDHLYPVARVSQSAPLRKKMKRQGINGLNDPKNLVPACWNCNKKKGTKMGLWIIRGKLGRSARLWYVRWCLRIIFLAAAAAAAIAKIQYGSIPFFYFFHFPG